MKSIKSKKKWVEDFNEATTLAEDLGVLLEFHEMGEGDETEIIKKVMSLV